MKRGTGAAACVALAAGSLALALTAGARPGAFPSAYPDAPPPATTGGFGEPTCVSCHFGTTPDTLGSLSLRGLPATFAPGRSYELVVELVREDVAAAGFELSARFASGPARGRQAGAFRVSGTDVTITPLGGVDYVHQTLAGASPAEPGRARWRVEWTAPDASEVPVRLHVAANAGNGDESPLGDRIYAIEETVAPAGGGSSSD